jgi:hypothetical protein
LIYKHQIMRDGMNETQKKLADATAFAQKHLRECCEEILELQDTGILRDGKMRELGHLCNLSKPYDLDIAKSLVTRAAFEEIVCKSSLKEKI